MRHAMRRLRSAVLTAAALAGAGCGDDDPAGPDGLSRCTGDLVVSVSGGTTPTISWTPACAAYALIVEEGASDRWFLRATSAAGIAPGVRYGTVPPGASGDGEPAVPLVAGRTYDVGVFRGTADNNATLAGTSVFTP